MKFWSIYKFSFTKIYLKLRPFCSGGDGFIWNCQRQWPLRWSGGYYSAHNLRLVRMKIEQYIWTTPMQIGFVWVASRSAGSPILDLWCENLTHVTHHRNICELVYLYNVNDITVILLDALRSWEIPCMPNLGSLSYEERLVDYIVW